MAAAAMPGAQLELAGVAGDGVGQSASFLTLPSDVCVRVYVCVKETDCLQYVCLPLLTPPPAALSHPLPLCSASSCNLKWTTPLKQMQLHTIHISLYAGECEEFVHVNGITLVMNGRF